MGRFGGTIMRGLAGALGGYNQGMEEEELRRQREAEQRNRDVNTRVNLRDAGYEDEEALPPLPASAFAQEIGGAGVNLSPIYDALLKKRLAGPSEVVGGKRLYAPLESRIEREARANKERLTEARRLAEAKAKADLAEAKVRAGEKQSLDSKFARADLTAAQADKRAADAAYNAMLRTRPNLTPDDQEQFPNLIPNFVADSTEKAVARDTAAERVAQLQQEADRAVGRPAQKSKAPVDRATWAAQNPPHPGESREAYKARYAKSSGR